MNRSSQTMDETMSSAKKGATVYSPRAAFELLFIKKFHPSDLSDVFRIQKKGSIRKLSSFRFHWNGSKQLWVTNGYPISLDKQCGPDSCSTSACAKRNKMAARIM